MGAQPGHRLTDEHANIAPAIDNFCRYLQVEDGTANRIRERIRRAAAITSATSMVLPLQQGDIFEQALAVAGACSEPCKNNEELVEGNKAEQDISNLAVH